jgi:hypothetical protein
VKGQTEGAEPDPIFDERNRCSKTD